MKKAIFTTLAFVAIFGLFLVSCEKDESSKHHYTQEELDEIARQDSLKQIIPVDYVFTQTVNVPITDDYTGITVPLCNDMEKLLELFEYDTEAELVAALGTLEGGAQTGNEITFYAYNYSTKYEYSSPSTTNYFGHWFDANGDVCSWGDQAYLFCEKVDETTLDFQIAPFPSRPAVGTSYKIVEAMKYDTTSVAFLFTVNIVDEIPLVYPVTTLQGSSDYNAEGMQNSSYTATPVVIDADAIAAAIGCAAGDAEIYGVDASDDSLYIEGSTAEAPGYWFNATGDVCNWGDDACAVFANYDITNHLFNMGQFPGGTTVDQVYTVTIAFVNLDNLKQYNVTINYKVTENPYPDITEVTAVDTIAFSTTAALAGDYASTSHALDSVGIYNAIGCGPSAAKLYGVNATTDLLYVTGYTTSGSGYWFNASGDVTTWGTENGSVMWVDYLKADQTLTVGQFPEACLSGTTYSCVLAFVNEGKQANIRIEMTIE